MAFLIPDKTENWNGVTVNKYLLTEHNPNKISMPTVKMPDSIKMGITIHNTDVINVASGTTCAEQYLRSTVNGNMKSTRVHLYIDDTCAWWCLPFDLSSWHAADGSGNGNRRTISIECIMNSRYNDTDKKAEDNAARIIAYLMNKYSWGIENLFTHTHWLAVMKNKTGTRKELNETKLGNGAKWCPAYILLHFDQFEAKIKSYLGNNDKITIVDKTESSYTYKKGDIVKIINGAVYTTCKTVPTWVINTEWIIDQVSSNTKVIIGKSVDGKSNINSPIDPKYLIPITTPQIIDVKDFTIKLNNNTSVYKTYNDSEKVGVIDKTALYTITHTCGGYGKLKSGMGWVKLN